MTRLAAICLTCFGLAGVGSSAFAALIVDQQYKPDSTFITSLNPDDEADSIHFNGPFGQTFTPTLNGLDFATFVIGSFGDVAGSYVVELRTGPTGTLLETSQTLALPAGYGASSGIKTEFDFANTIALNAGTSYALLLVRLDASSNLFAAGDQVGAYSGGAKIIRGGVAAGDLSFSEGLRTASTTIPEPGIVALLGLGGVAAFGAVRRRKLLASPR